MKNIRRKGSLERLASPEQLDRLLVIIRLPGWIALLCLVIIILAILLWSIFGQIPITTSGTGIFFDPRSIELIKSDVEGIVKEVYVKDGVSVKKGDQLLTITDYPKPIRQKELNDRIQQWEEEIALERKNTMISLEHNRSIYALQEQRLKELEAAPEMKQELYDLRVEMKKQEELIALLEKKLEVPEGSLELIELKQQKKILQDRIEGMIVRAPADGKVLTIEVLRGEDVRLGKTLLWFQEVEKPDERELVYGFFSIAKGDLIRPGMSAHIMFDSVRTAIYGKMEGVVKEILPFAASPQGDILQSIPSPSLREYLSKKEARVMVVVEPTRDPTTPSGYKWTNNGGPPYQIHADSVADVRVFLGEKRPITYLIPIGADR